MQTCSVCQVLPTLQLLAHLYELLPSIGIRRPSVNFLKNLLLWNHWANLNQTWPESSLGVPFKIISDDPVDQPSWPPYLLIEHRGKINKKINKKNPEKSFRAYCNKIWYIYVIFFQNYGWGPHPPSNMATIDTINRKLVKKIH